MKSRKKVLLFSAVLGLVIVAVSSVALYRTNSRSSQAVDIHRSGSSANTLLIEHVPPDHRTVKPPSEEKPVPDRTSDKLISAETTPVLVKDISTASNQSIDELIASAEAAMSRKAYDKAREDLESALLMSTDPDKRMAIGQMLYKCLVRTHAYDEALELGQELLTLSPSPDERLVLTQQLAALLHAMGKPSEAETLLSNASDGTDDPATRAKYEAQLRSIWRHTPGRTGEVVSNLTEAVVANPQDEATLRQLGDIYLKSRRDYKAAEPVYEQLAALHPEDPQIQSTLIGIYRENQNYDGVRRVFEMRLAQSGGDDPTLRFQIAQTELQAGRGDDAVAYAEKHLSGDEATAFQLQMLSTVYDKAGRKDAAAVALDTAIDRETNAQQRVSMQFQKVERLIWSKQFPDAESLLRSIIQVAGDDKQTVSRAKGEIVRIYELQGKLAELNI